MTNLNDKNKTSACELPLADMSGVKSFLVLDILNEANALQAQGRDIIHMEAGQPSLGAPKAALEAGEKAMMHMRLGYTEACGRPSLRARIAEHYLNYYGANISPEQVIVTTGSSAAFSLAFLNLAGKHRRMAFPVPGYPAYRSIARAYGIDVVDLPAGRAQNWMPDPEAIERLHLEHGLDAILIASPNNPTGTMITPDVLKRIVDMCEKHGIWIISDEIYHGLTYGGQDETLLNHTQNALIINSFSKYYGMTGWRIGWMVVPLNIVRQLETLAQHLFISPPTMSQVVAEAAMDAKEELEARVRSYQENRDLLLEGLRDAGFGAAAPVDGAFYAYINISHISNDSLSLAKQILQETGVALTPGLDFDTDTGSQYIRLSFAESKEKIKEAVARLRHWMTEKGHIQSD